MICESKLQKKKLRVTENSQQYLILSKIFECPLKSESPPYIMEFSFTFELHLDWIWITFEKARLLFSFGSLSFVSCQPFAFAFGHFRLLLTLLFGRVMILSIFAFVSCQLLLLLLVAFGYFCLFCWQSLFLLWYWGEYSKTVIFIADFQIDWWNWTVTCFFILFFFWINRCKNLLHDLFVFIFCFCLC